MLCDVLPDGTIAGTALVEAVYDEATGLRTGTRVVNPVTGAAYVPTGILQPCGAGVGVEDAVVCYTTAADPTPRQGFRRETISGAGLSVVEFLGDTGATVVPDAWTPGPCPQTIFAGFVCDVFGGTPFIPATPPTCPGTALGAPVGFFAGEGMTEGPAGTFTPTSNSSTTLNWNRSPNDAQHGLCSVRFVNDPGTGNDPFWQLVGSFVDLAGNGQILDATWITAIETALGVGDAADIPAGSTATAPIAGTSVTITFDGPSPHSQMFGGNGAFFIREQDGDGLAAGVTLEFNPPIQAFNVFANVTTPTPGSVSGVQEAQAAPGTAAVAAAPAGVFEVKQFRAPDGTAFYENLDGTAHPVLGTVGECGTFVHEQLCDSTGSVPFLRVYTITGGAVSDLQDYDLSGAPYAVVGTAVRCQTQLADLRLVESEVLCYTAADGITITQFLRRYLMNQDGVTVIAVVDTLLDGITPFVTVVGGTVALCSADGCNSSSIGTVCYTPPPTSSPGAHFTDTWLGSAVVGANGGPQTITNADFGPGAGPVVFTGAAFGVTGAAIINGNSGQPVGTFAQSIDLGAPRMNVVVRFVSFSAGDAYHGITPAFTSFTPISGPGTAIASGGNTALDPSPTANLTVDLLFAGPVQVINFNYVRNATTSGTGIRDITFDSLATVIDQDQGTAAVVRDCETGVVSYIDLATGAAIDVSSVTIVDCGAADTCASLILGEVCYTPPPAPAVFLSDDFTGSTDTGVSPGPITYTVPNFGGGVPSMVMVAQRSIGGHPGSPAGAQIGGVSTPAGTGNVTLDLGQPLVNVTVEIFAFDSTGGEQLLNVSPAFASVSGNGTAAAGNTTINPTLPTPPAGTIVIHFGTTPVQNISFDYKNTTVAGIGIRTITGSTVAAGGAVGHASVVRDCAAGTLTYVDLATGATLDVSSVTIVECETSTTGQTPEALTLCDITQVPSLNGARSVLNLTTLPTGPTAGTFGNGIGYTVDQGFAGGSGTYLINASSTQTWTFNQPAMLRFGVNNLNVGAECVTLPVGTVVESIHANHTYNAGTRVLCNGGAALVTDESIFTLAAATSLAIVSNPGGGGQRGLVRLEAALTTFTEVRTPFLRTICRTCGAVPVITDTTMNGLTAYVPTGTVGVCDVPYAPDDSCSVVVLGEVCYTPPVAVQTLSDDWTGATSVLGGGSRVWTNANFGGVGLTVTETVTPDTGAALLFAGVQNMASGPATEHTVIDLGAPRTNVTVRIEAFGTGAGERLRNITPAFSSISGNGVAVLANTGADGGPGADATVFLTFAGPVQTIAWDYAPTGVGALSSQTFLTFNTAAASDSAPAAVLRDCTTGATTLIDLATGTVLNPANITIVDCPTTVTVATDPVVLTAQARLLTNAAPWVPGTDVGGTLTSLSVTGLSGLWNVTDQNGTVLAGLPPGLTLEWNAEDANALSGPLSVTPQAGASVVAVWTQR